MHAKINVEIACQNICMLERSIISLHKMKCNSTIKVFNKFIPLHFESRDSLFMYNFNTVKRAAYMIIVSYKCGTHSHSYFILCNKCTSYTVFSKLCITTCALLSPFLIIWWLPVSYKYALYAPHLSFKGCNYFLWFSAVSHTVLVKLSFLNVVS